MRISGWGNHPKKECKTLDYEDVATLSKLIAENSDMIPRGNGRSYGDSALNDNVVDVRPHDRFIAFDTVKGVLHVQAGVLLSEILNSFVHRGWFLRITPGTKFITVGGAIASDVHGKNHHVEGCFSECVVDFRLMLPSGEVVVCSKDKNSELFHATCGGMGLTGIILDARILLKRVKSQYLKQMTL